MKLTLLKETVTQISELRSGRTVWRYAADDGSVFERSNLVVIRSVMVDVSWMDTYDEQQSQLVVNASIDLIHNHHYDGDCYWCMR